MTGGLCWLYSAMRIKGDYEMEDVIRHYDSLVEQNNDPVFDPPELQKYMNKWDGERFIEKIRLTPESNVLEIGVGTGRLALKTAPFCNNLYGIDISPKTIERAKENLKSFQNVNLICDDFLTVEFKEKFDVIYSSLTFMHIKDKQKAVNKVFTLLNSGGRFVLSIDKSQNTLLDIGTSKIEIYPDTPDDMTLFLQNAGFKNIEQIEIELGFIVSVDKID